jgi:hypothetical protein
MATIPSPGTSADVAATITTSDAIEASTGQIVFRVA